MSILIDLIIINESLRKKCTAKIRRAGKGRGELKEQKKWRNKSNNRNYFNESRHRGKIERMSIFLGQI